MRNLVIFLACFFILLGLSRLSLFKIGSENVGVDDASIFFVYAKNFAEGHGFVYNVGGERVEGFSSMLWTLVLAGIFTVTTEPKTLILFVNLILGAVTLTCLASFLRDFNGRQEGRSDPWFLDGCGFLLLAWSLCSPGFVIWTTITLMENGLWTMVAVLASLHMLQFAREEMPPLRTRAIFAVLLALVILCRPEGMLWAAVLGSGSFLARWLQGRVFAQSIKEVALPAAACLLTVAGLFAFRHWYFGYPFPNTYYAKVSPDRIYNLLEGAKYLVRFQLSHWLIPILYLTTFIAGCKLLVCVARRFRPQDSPRRRVSTSDLQVGLLSLVLLVAGLIPVLVGGDHFVMFRFYQVTWPLLPLPLLILAGPMVAERLKLSAPWRNLLPVLAVILFIFLSSDPWHRIGFGHRMHSEFKLVKRDLAVGNSLNQSFDEMDRPSIGVVAAGAIAFAYQGEVIDMMGLNNLEMAHSEGDRKGRKNHAAFNKEVLMRQRPHILLPGLVDGIDVLVEARRDQLARHAASPGTDVLKGLCSEQRFLDLYQLGAMEVSGSKLLGGWFRKDYLETLEGRLFHPVLDP